MGYVAKRIKLAASSILFFQPDVSKEYNAERQGGGEEAKLRWLTLTASTTYQAAIPDTKSCYPATPPPDPTPNLISSFTVRHIEFKFSHSMILWKCF
jgi:hypothetical protein